MSRRFPTPWTQNHNEDVWWVEAANGRRFAHCYVLRTGIVDTTNYMSEDEARRITANIAKLPELLLKGNGDGSER